MIQLYMHIHDLKPFEIPDWEVQLDEAIPGWGGTVRDQIKDIQKHGIKMALKVSPEGFIEYGNTRYWIARKLYEEGDIRFEYLPVQIDTFAGIKIVEVDTLPNRKQCLELANVALRERHAVVPPATTLKKYFRMETHPRRVKNRDGQPDAINTAFFVIKHDGKYRIIFFNESIADGLLSYLPMP